MTADPSSSSLQFSHGFPASDLAHLHDRADGISFSILLLCCAVLSPCRHMQGPRHANAISKFTQVNLVEYDFLRRP